MLRDTRGSDEPINGQRRRHPPGLPRPCRCDRAGVVGVAGEIERSTAPVSFFVSIDRSHRIPVIADRLRAVSIATDIIKIWRRVCPPPSRNADDKIAAFAWHPAFVNRPVNDPATSSCLVRDCKKQVEQAGFDRSAFLRSRGRRRVLRGPARDRYHACP
jgi:hypothetical protein